MAGIRLSGMVSNLDTEAIVNSLVSAKSERKTSLEKEQTKLSWTQDAWKALNTKIYNFYSKTLGNSTLVSDYTKKATKTSNPAVSVITGASAALSTQSLKIKSMAKAGYHTGAELKVDGAKASYTSDTKLSDMGITGDKTFKITVAGEEKTIEVNGDTTIASLTSKLSESGLTANFDAKNQRFFISANKAGTEFDFSYDTNDADTNELLSALGLDGNGGVKLPASDAEIELNGEIFKDNTNTFEINGLTITINNLTEDEITLTTEQDTQGIFDMVKNFFKEYNALINEMDKLYNADSASKYKMLSSEEKEEMSEEDVKEWEDKIKSALLRSDGTLGNVASSLKTIMLQGVTVNSKKMYLSDFGIATAGYFTSAENEKNAYHIDGDEDDSVSSTKENKLKAMIASDPDTVATFFADLSKNLFSKLYDLMRKTEYSSMFTVYNDMLMKNQYKDYTSKIEAQQKKINTWEDYYYKKFTTMEKALSNLDSKQSAISGLLGS